MSDAMAAVGNPRLGAVLPQAEIRPSDPADVRRFALAVEAAGFDHLLAYDHVLGADSDSRPDWDGYYDHTTPFLEPLTLFAYLAGFSKLEMVTDIMILPQRQTALVAKQAATLDLLLEGRLRLGVGIGWNEVEYEALGVPFAARAARFEEQLGLLRKLWTQPVVRHSGRFETVDRAGIEPRPVQQPIPLWIGCGDAPPALDRVGRLADGWIPHPALGSGHELAAAWKIVRESAERAGRDPDALGLQGQVRARETSLADVRADVGRWTDLGATHVAVNPLQAGLTWPEEHIELCEHFAHAWKGTVNAR